MVHFASDVNARLVKHGLRNVWVVNPGEQTSLKEVELAAARHNLLVHEFRYSRQKEKGLVVHRSDTFLKKIMISYVFPTPHGMTSREVEGHDGEVSALTASS